jgi:hypothetical protein
VLDRLGQLRDDHVGQAQLSTPAEI